MNELDKAVKDLNKRFGKNYIDYGGKAIYDEYKRHSFGVTALDFATGGGIPTKKVTTIAGKYSSGKTTSAMCAIAEIQRNGGKAALIDTENSYDPNYIQKLGVNYNDLLICQPDTIEEVTDTVETLLIAGELDLLVIDSIAATSSEKELKGSGEDKSMGGIAKEVGLLMRKVTARQKKVGTSVLLINQLRDKVSGWGSSSYMPGGTQLKNQSHIIIHMRSGGWIGDKKAPKGMEIKFRVSKNKTAPPLKTGSFELLFEGKINNEKSLVEEAVRYGVIKKAGGWYHYKNEDDKVQGLDNLVEELSEEDLKTIKKETLDKIKN